MESKGRLFRRSALALLAGGALGLVAGGAVLGRRRGWRGRLAGWLRRLQHSSAAIRPQGIVIHHSAAEPWRQKYETAASIDADHAKRGLGVSFEGKVYHIAYHYVIMPDGKVVPGRPERCRGAHTRSKAYNRWVGICLIGYFDPKWMEERYHRPTDEQMTALAELSRDLMVRYGFGLENIVPHHAVNPTECPGKSFPWDQMTALVNKSSRGLTAETLRRREEKEKI